MIEDFKKKMVKEFEMTDIGLMLYYLGIEVWQTKTEIFIFQKNYAKEILKKFKMDMCKPINTPLEYGIKLSRKSSGEKIDPTL